MSSKYCPEVRESDPITQKNVWFRLVGTENLVGGVDSVGASVAEDDDAMLELSCPAHPKA